MRRAEKMLANSEFQQALPAFKDAYNLIVAALIRVRENDTVVYGLDFRTPADEYRYELMQRVRLWRYISGQPDYDVGERFLRRLEYQPNHTSA